MSAATAGRRARSQVGAYIAGGLAVWVCGAAAILLASGMIVVLAEAGWHDIVRISAGVPGFGTLLALRLTASVIGLALPAAVILSFLAGVAAAEPAIGGRAGRLLNLSLRAGPAVPSVAIGVAAFAFVIADKRMHDLVVGHPVVAAAVALAALNLPIMSARFRAVFRVVPRTWRVAATAAGATPGAAFLRIVLPRAWPGIIAAVLNAAGQMLGETAVLAIMLSMIGGPKPLSVDLWQRLVRPVDSPDAVAAAASETLVLVVAIVALRFAARVLQHRRRLSGLPA